MAAGPKRIAEEFVDRLREMQETMRRIEHALGYAPGCDLFDDGRWQILYRGAQDVLRILEEMRKAAQQEADEAEEGTAEQVRKYRQSLEYAVKKSLKA